MRKPRGSCKLYDTDPPDVTSAVYPTLVPNKHT